MYNVNSRKSYIWAIPCKSEPIPHTREKTSPSLRFSIPEQGKERQLVSVFFWHANCCLICDRISIRRCVVYRQKWLEGQVAPPAKSQFRGQDIRTAIFAGEIWEMRYWKTPPTIIWIAQFKLPYVMLICVHTGQNTVIRMIRNTLIQISHFTLIWKLSYSSYISKIT